METAVGYHSPSTFIATMRSCGARSRLLSVCDWLQFPSSATTPASPMAAIEKELPSSGVVTVEAATLCSSPCAATSCNLCDNAYCGAHTRPPSITIALNASTAVPASPIRLWPRYSCAEQRDDGASGAQLAQPLRAVIAMVLERRQRLAQARAFAQHSLPLPPLPSVPQTPWIRHARMTRSSKAV